MTTRTILDTLARHADPTGRLAAYLAAGSFYDDPASLARHRSYPSGLADHTLGVYLELRSLSHDDGPAPMLVALAHDLCKVGTYQQVMKSVKMKDSSGRFLTDYRGKPRWDDVPGYEFIESDMPVGHGDSSVVRLMEVFGNDAVPADWHAILLAIRWHMGAFSAPPGEEQNRMAAAMARTKLVIWTQAADLLDTHHGAETSALIARAMQEIPLL